MTITINCSKDEDMSLSLISKKNPESYALNLMDTLFTDEEMKGHLLVKKRSRSNRDALDPVRVKKRFGEYSHQDLNTCISMQLFFYYPGLVASEFGKETTKQKFEEIIEKCNQKCRDKEKLKLDDNSESLLDTLLED